MIHYPKHQPVRTWRSTWPGWLSLLAAAMALAASHGCGRPSGSDNGEESSPPFAFRRLDLQQRNKDGLPAWSLKSPEARYDIRSSVARVLRPEGVIYAKGQPLYTLASTTGTVINDGEVILMEGSIRLQRLGRNPLLISADRALWIPRESLMRFELNPRVRDPQNQLSSQSATLLIDRDLLQLRGQPQLERWSQPSPLNGAPPASAPEIIGTVREVEWHPGTGELRGQGPVSFSRRPPRGAPTRPPQVLKALRLEGNTLKQLYTLHGPVAIDDPAERGWFRGGALGIDINNQRLTSAAPFQAQQGTLQLGGEALRVEGKSTTASIEGRCLLRQTGGDELQAQRCRWNWTTQAVEAEGDVLVHRPSNGQSTRAQRIEGELGPQGRVLASSPGGRVITEVQVPRRTGVRPPPRTPSKPLPIAF